jgi:uncharacterized membrane protein
MKKAMKKFLIAFKSKYYLVPALYAVLFTIIAGVFIKIDYYSNTSDKMPSFMFMQSASGSNVLIMIISGLVAVVTVAYTIIMIVLTIYGNQFSPRTLQDFLEKKATRSIMGYFIGILIFSIISLFGIKQFDASSYILSPTAAILFFIVAIVVFIYFMHLIEKSLQITIYIQKMVEETNEFIDQKQHNIEDDPNIYIESIDKHKKLLKKNAWELMPEKSGFIQFYDEKKLFEFACAKNIIIYCNRKEGEHIMEDAAFIKLYSTAKKAVNGDMDEDIRKLASIGDDPNLKGDVFNKIRILVEIAVRALSPGVNDPATAIFCIDKIGFLLHRTITNSEAKVYKDNDNNVKLILEGFTTKKMLFDYFYQIKHYGIRDLKVFSAILSAINNIAQNGTATIKNEIWEFGEYLFNEVRLNEYADLEKRYLYESFYQLAQATDHTKEVKSLFNID